MPLITSQMPSGALQYPIIARPDASSQMFGFTSQRQPDNGDTAALLALVQYMSQGKQMNLERELRRDDQALRREEMANLLGIKKDEIALAQQAATDTRTQNQQQFDFLNTNQNNQFTALMKQLELQGKEYDDKSKMTGAQIEQMQAQIREMEAQRKDQEQAITDARKVQFGSMVSNRNQAESAGALAAADEKVNQTVAEAKKGFESGLARYGSFERDDLKAPLGRLVNNGSVQEDDVPKLTSGLLEETKAVTEAAKATKDPHVRAALLAKQNEKIRAVRSAISDPERLTSWADTSRDWTGLSRWLNGGDPVVGEKQKLLSSAAFQAERMLNQVGDVPPAANVDVYVNTLSPDLMKSKAQARAQVATTSAERSDAIMRAMSSPSGVPEDILKAVLSQQQQQSVPGMVRVGPTVQAAQAVAQPEWDPFLAGLTGR